MKQDLSDAKAVAVPAVPAPLEQIAPPLLAWYRACGRKLPWRSDPTPYRVWVSEIMLQQTRVETVKPYFARFIEALPTVKDLAEAPEEQLLKLWEGLGYYSRVRNMQKAAQQVMRDYGGALPRDRDALLSLCGIGSYTAGAISAFAFGLPEPAVDGNVLRVVARLTAIDRNILEPSVKSEFESYVRAVIPTDAAGDFGQALIELGALVCLPGRTESSCGDCPLADLCRARAQGLTGILPVRYKMQTKKEENRTVLLICDQNGDRVLLQKRPDKGLLAGLWQYPNELGHLSPEQAAQTVREMGAEVLAAEPLPAAKHVFTHLIWHMIGYRVTVRELPATCGIAASRQDLQATYALPSAFSAYRDKCLP